MPMRPGLPALTKPDRHQLFVVPVLVFASNLVYNHNGLP